MYYVLKTSKTRRSGGDDNRSARLAIFRTAAADDRVERVLQRL